MVPTAPSAGDYITRADDNDDSYIRIEDATSFGTYVTDDSPDFVVKGILTLVAPTSGTLLAGIDCASSHTITWERQGRIESGNVKYATDGETFTNLIQGNIPFDPVTSGTQASTASQWSVPETPVTTTYQILIEDNHYEKLGAAGTFIESDTFRIKGALTLTAPTEIAIWRVTEQKTITWEVDHGQINKVKIVASKSGDFSGK